MLTNICRDHYLGNHRHYHTWEHAISVGSMASTLAKSNGLSEDTMNDLWTAGIWHDAVYVIGSKTNEEDSAAAMQNNTDGNTDHIADWIRHTTIEDHLSDEPVSLELACLLDADLASLALDYKIFLKCQLNICIEQGCYLVDQAKFLLKFLEKKQIFRTKMFHETLEETARRNIHALMYEVNPPRPEYEKE
jgi:predicted metal-dependent HD superfamily phosphohydrolase